MPVHILVADSRQMEPQLLVGALRRHSEFNVKSCMADADAIKSKLSEDNFDVVLLNATSSNGQVLERIRLIRHSSDRSRLVLMVDACDRDVVVNAFRSGVRGIFRVAEQPFKLLCKCILRVHRGEVWASAEEVDWLLDAVSQTPAMREPLARTGEHLTAREDQVVRLVAEGLSNKEISSELKISEHTVKRHLVRIFEKLKVTNRVELVLNILSWGSETPGRNESVA